MLGGVETSFVQRTLYAGMHGSQSQASIPSWQVVRLAQLRRTPVPTIQTSQPANGNNLPRRMEATTVVAGASPTMTRLRSRALTLAWP